MACSWVCWRLSCCAALQQLLGLREGLLDDGEADFDAQQAEEVEAVAADPAVHEAEADKKEADVIEEPAVAEPPAFFGKVAK